MTKVIVYHSSYGCGTGCCGHVIAIVDNDGNEVEREFEFAHPWGVGNSTDPYTWAKQLVNTQFGPSHAADLDWENCIISDD